MSKHTPTPWSFTKAKHGIEGGSFVICECREDDDEHGDRAMVIHAPEGNDEQQQANAAFIVKAVNAHDRLVEALIAVMPFVQTDNEFNTDDWNNYNEAKEKVRAILAEVKS